MLGLDFLSLYSQPPFFGFIAWGSLGNCKRTFSEVTILKQRKLALNFSDNKSFPEIGNLQITGIETSNDLLEPFAFTAEMFCCWFLKLGRDIDNCCPSLPRLS